MKTHNKLLTAITVVILLVATVPSVEADHVRKSRSGICHVEGDSPYFNRLKYFETYHSVNECLNPDGRARVGDEYIPKYERNFFGSSWADVDGDGQNTRAEELIKQSTGPVLFRSERERIVDTGRWNSIFTNEIITRADQADVDHIVPLKWAWDHGAYQWDYEKRVKFANDPINLAVVEFSLNRSKGAKGPTEWLPPENRCGYILRFTRIYKTYGLQLSSDEQEDFDFIKSDLCGK